MTKCSPDSDREITLKIGQYLFDEVKAYEKVCQFLGHPVQAAFRYRAIFG